MIWPKAWIIMKYKNLLSHMKMGKAILTFVDIKILKDVDIEKVLISKKIYSGEKTMSALLVTCMTNYKVKPLHIMLPKATVYVKRYDGQTKWMHFLIGDDAFLEKYDAIWDKVTANILKKNLIASLSIIKDFWRPK